MSLDLTFERLMAAVPDRVFDAFTEPIGQHEFYGQDAAGWIVDSRCELRVGGVWSVWFGPSRDALYHHHHVFEVIDRPRRILITSTETRLDDSSFTPVPIFVPTRGEPPAPDSDLVHYVTDGVESAMRQAKEAAGDANVLVHGADLAQSCLRADVLDELEIHLVPVLLGAGRTLFGELAEHIELELTRVLDAPGVTHLRFRVKA